MRQNKIYKDLHFTSDYSVEDWNELIEMKFGKYFADEEAFVKNKELLRTELINYVKFSNEPDYIKLFEWTIDLFIECLNMDKEKIIEVLADTFIETSKTDITWMTNIVIQPNVDDLSEHDKITLYFRLMDEILEGLFKPRFKLLDKIVNYKLFNIIPDNSKTDFGKLIKDFPVQVKACSILYLEDPIFSISTNQWRNIAAHKSYIINKNDIVIEYGRGSIQTLTISYENFFKVMNWIKNMYSVIRLSQVLIQLSNMEDLVVKIDENEKISIRLESSLVHIIHNIQVVGFEFVSIEDADQILVFNVKGKINHDVKDSLIHASQCLDRLSCAIDDDLFVRDKYKYVKICIVDDKLNILASANVSIEIAIKKTRNELSLEEYINRIEYNIENYA